MVPVLGSSNFDAAISDVKRCFPDGVWTQEANTVLKDYAVSCWKQSVE